MESLTSSKPLDLHGLLSYIFTFYLMREKIVMHFGYGRNFKEVVLAYLKALLQHEHVMTEEITELTLWSSALLERSLVVWSPDSFPAFYGTRRFIITRALHLFLS
jgi:hypothetical protein